VGGGRPDQRPRRQGAEIGSIKHRDTEDTEIRSIEKDLLLCVLCVSVVQTSGTRSTRGELDVLRINRQGATHAKIGSINRETQRAQSPEDRSKAIRTPCAPCLRVQLLAHEPWCSARWARARHGLIEESGLGVLGGLAVHPGLRPTCASRRRRSRRRRASGRVGRRLRARAGAGSTGDATAASGCRRPTGSAARARRCDLRA
jgi:hypothetical protein